MYKVKDIVAAIPAMKAGNELESALTVMPNYSEEMRYESEAVRLMLLSDIYQIYIPSSMSYEIYNKLYLSLLRSLQKKCMKTVIQQQNQNYKAIQQQEYRGIIGGSDSFTIIGCSGIGKSSAISRAISLITENRIIEIDEPYSKIIPCLVVQCPFDSSVKGLLLEILRKVDEYFGSKYYENALRAKSTTDMLIGSVSQIALNHIGLLIVDEIQNVCNSKNGNSLVGMLTQLINNSGISICMVGTPESSVFFEQAMQLARRSLGLQYSSMKYDVNFYRFCQIVFSYQYVKQKTEITTSLVEWLYEHSSGNTSIVISLIHDAQEIAILNGKEILDIDTLNEAYQQRLALLHDYIVHPTTNRERQNSKVRKKKKASDIKEVVEEEKCNTIESIFDLVTRAKKESMDIVQLLKARMEIVEVVI